MKQFKGVIPGIVANLEDPQGMGRIQVHFPRMSGSGSSSGDSSSHTVMGENRSFWASVAAPMAGKKRGFFYQPELEDEVLVAFEEGDPQHPYIVGLSLEWRGPSTNH